LSIIKGNSIEKAIDWHSRNNPSSVLVNSTVNSYNIGLIWNFTIPIKTVRLTWWMRGINPIRFVRQARGLLLTARNSEVNTENQMKKGDVLIIAELQAFSCKTHP
jgi:hypothetical protein